VTRSLSGRRANKRIKLTGAAILVSRGMKVLQAAPAAYPYRSARKVESSPMVWLDPSRGISEGSIMSRSICFMTALTLTGWCGAIARAEGDLPPIDPQVQQAIDRGLAYLRRAQTPPADTSNTWLFLESLHQTGAAPASAPAQIKRAQQFIESMQQAGAVPAAGPTRVTVKGGVVEIEGGVIRITGADVLIELPGGRR
jgi:hypothetical protein